MRHWWPLTARGTLTAIAAVAAVVAGARFDLAALQFTGVAMLLLLVLCALQAWFWPAWSKIERRITSEPVAAGSEVSVTIALIRGARSAPRMVRWRDTLPPGLDGSPSGTVPAGSAGEQRFGYTLRARARGVHEIGPLELTADDGFGLARRVRTMSSATTLTVGPALVPVAALSRSAGHADGAVHSTTSHAGEGAANLIARPYAAGDSMRRIHWRASAHRGEWMVRQEEQESAPDAWVVFDRSPSEWRGADPFDDAPFETALSMTISAAVRLLHEGYRVSIVDTAGAALTAQLDEDADIPLLLADFAVAQPAAHDIVPAALVEGSAAMQGPIVLICGPRPDQRVWRLRLSAAFAVGAQPDVIAAANAAGLRAASVAPAGGDDVASAWARAWEGQVDGAA